MAVAGAANWLKWPAGFWIGALIAHLSLFNTQYAYGEFYHRCRSPSAVEPSNVSLLVDLQQQTECTRCVRNATTFWGFEDDDYVTDDLLHVVIMVSSSRSLERALIVSAGLLTVDVRVTLILESTKLPRETIRTALSQHIPCEYEDHFQSMMFDYISLASNIACENDLQCHILTAAPVVHALADYGDVISSADAVVVDAAFVPAMLTAEAYLIPSLYLVEDPLTYTKVVTQTAPWTSPFSVLRERLEALDFPFAALNRVRTQMLGLTRVRNLRDIWYAGIVWLPYDQELVGVRERILSINGPYLPPCFPCDYELEQANNRTQQPPSIVVSATYRSDAPGRAALRNVIRSLTLARSSLRTCAFKSSTPDAVSHLPCWNYTKPFRIILLGPKPDFELPDHIHYTSTGLLDALAVFAPTVALAARCDDTNGAWTSSLGLPIICVDEPRSKGDTLAYHLIERLAVRVIQVLTESPGSTSTYRETVTSSQDALVSIINVIQTMAAIKSEFGSDWKDGWDLKRDLQTYLLGVRSYEPPENRIAINFNSAAVYPAWLMIAAAVLYLVLSGKCYLRHPGRVARRWQKVHSWSTSHIWLSAAALLDEFWGHLPELDHVWILWAKWGQVMWSQMQDQKDLYQEDATADQTSSRATNGVAAVDPRLSLRMKRRVPKSKRH